MLTIDRLVKIDNIATRIIAALHRGIEWVGDHYEARLVDATYRVAEAKATAICKAEDKISDLEDDRAEITAMYLEEKAKLQATFQRLVETLDKIHTKAEDGVHAKLAAAAEALVAANKDYDATLKAASEKLGVEVGA